MSARSGLVGEKHILIPFHIISGQFSIGHINANTISIFANLPGGGADSLISTGVSLAAIKMSTIWKRTIASVKIRSTASMLQRSATWN